MSMRSRTVGTPSRRSYLLRWILVLGGTVIAFALIFVFPIGMFFAVGFPETPAPVVSSIIAEVQPWQPNVEVVGSFSASEGADLAVEVAGIVDQVYFESGGEVSAVMAKWPACSTCTSLLGIESVIIFPEYQLSGKTGSGATCTKASATR